MSGRRDCTHPRDSRLANPIWCFRPLGSGGRLGSFRATVDLRSCLRPLPPLSLSPLVVPRLLLLCVAAITLIFRFVCTEGDAKSGWRNVHDFINAELNRLARLEAGALVSRKKDGWGLGGSYFAAARPRRSSVAEMTPTFCQFSPQLFS